MAKPGSCTSLPLYYTDCHRAVCTGDSMCPGAQKCCAYGPCPGADQCQDPVGLQQCVYDGDVYYPGETFTPNPCVTCECTRDRSYGDPRYGGAVCRIKDCPILDCPPEQQLPSADQCCKTCVAGNATRSLTITNCPQAPLTHDLHAGETLYDLREHWQLEYSDSLDAGQDVEISWSRYPLFTWQHSNGNQQPITVTATGGSHTDSCTLSVIINGELIVMA